MARKVTTNLHPKKSMSMRNKKKIEEKPWPNPSWPAAFQALAKEYENVLVTEHSPADRIQCPELEIKLKPGVSPYFAKRPPRMPLHWRQRVEQEKQKLIKEGVIQRVVGESPRWVSPTGFVAQDHRKKN